MICRYEQYVHSSTIFSFAVGILQTGANTIISNYVLLSVFDSDMLDFVKFHSTVSFVYILNILPEKFLI